MSDRELMLICVPVALADTVVPGSIMTECAECHCKVWISLDGQRVRTVRPLCFTCAKRQLAQWEKAGEPITYTTAAAEAAKVKQ